ncbi:MAG: sulfatase-like hydrolase/transferase, partial [Phycisphaerae bacterium]
MAIAPSHLTSEPTAAIRRVTPLVYLACVLAMVGLTACRSESNAPGGATVDGVPATYVVLFLIDTLRADRLGLYGYDKPTSPNIDALAAESVVFDDASAPAPWTLPSVVSALTSTWLCEHNVLVDGQRINAALTPLAERLGALGYKSAALLRNPYSGAMSGLDRGYDVSRMIKQPVDGAIVETFLESAGTAP